MFGKILQVNISNGGLPKRPILLGKADRSGLEGDRFDHPNIHGGPDQALLLLADETVHELTGLGYPVYPGALGENLTTTGLDPRDWRSGQQYRVGSARIELTKPRAPCRTLDRFGHGNTGSPIQNIIFDSQVKLGLPATDCWGKSGFYARVVEPGEIAPGDRIILESELA